LVLGARVHYGKENKVFNRRDFGNRMRKLRTDSGLTIKQFSENAKVSQPCVYTYERGHTIPSLETSDTMCRGLGVNLQWLATGEGPKERMEL